MIEQIGSPLPFTAFYTTLGIGTTGLTVTIDVYRNSSLVIASGTVTEIGGGFYTYTLSSGTNTIEGIYAGVFKTSTTTVDQQHVAMAWEVGKAGVEFLDTAISSRLPTSGYTIPDNTTIGNIYTTVQTIPTNPLLTTDVRLNNLDTTISSRSTLTANDVWSYATRTLSSFGTLVSDIWSNVTRTLTSGGGGGASAADVWSYATRTLTQTAEQIIQSLTDNTDINVYKSTTFDVTLQNLPDFTGWQRVWFTVKDSINFETPDSESIIQVQLTATGTASDGLLWINKSSAIPTDGHLLIPDTTTVGLYVDADVTGNLPPKTLYYGIKYLNSVGDVVSLSEGGKFVINYSTSKKVS